MKLTVCATDSEIQEELKTRELLGLWENITGKKANYCLFSNCVEQKVLAGIKVCGPEPDKNIHIIPLCEAHARCSEQIEVEQYSQLVPLN